MGDYTSMELNIVAIPDGMSDQVFELLDDQWNVRWCDKVTVDTLIGDTLTTDEARLCYLTDELAPQLIELGVVFHGFESPKYEYPGDYVAYTPGLGEFRSECDAAGIIVFDASALVTAIDFMTDIGPVQHGKNSSR
jgi:hypothetical protein